MSIKTRMYNDSMSVRWLVKNEPNFLFIVDYYTKDDSVKVHHEDFGTSDSPSVALKSEYLLSQIFKDPMNATPEELAEQEDLFSENYKDILVALKLIESNKENLKLIK